VRAMGQWYAPTMGRLSPQQVRFLQLIRSHHVGDTVSRQALLDGTGWTPKSLDTHLSKNKLVEFLDEQEDGEFRILRTGDSVSEDDVHRAMTQVSAKALVLAKGDVLTGSEGIYALERPLGSGAVGHVWQARDVDREVSVALKVAIPRPDLLEPSRLGNVRARFRREAHQGLKLKHECVVRVSDSGEFKSHPFLVMELAKRSLGQCLRAEGPISTDRSLEVIERCSQGLRYLHDCGCVHRDVKPDNMLETERGVIVGDLGIVHWGDMNPAFTSAATLTRDSVQLGSWYYMAPEQLQAPHSATSKSDVYALGVSWYQLLTGTLPSPAQFAARKCPPPCEDTAIATLIADMTSYAPEDRPSLDAIDATLAAT
jgi:serine/threonine protein kinase